MVSHLVEGGKDIDMPDELGLAWKFKIPKGWTVPRQEIFGIMLCMYNISVRET